MARSCVGTMEVCCFRRGGGSLYFYVTTMANPRALFTYTYVCNFVYVFFQALLTSPPHSSPAPPSLRRGKRELEFYVSSIFENKPLGFSAVHIR